MEISELDGGRSNKCTLEPVAQLSLDRNLEELVKDGAVEDAARRGIGFVNDEGLVKVLADALEEKIGDGGSTSSCRSGLEVWVDRSAATKFPAPLVIENDQQHDEDAAVEAPAASFPIYQSLCFSYAVYHRRRRWFQNRGSSKATW
ncbi:hypothetical protein PIB30_085536 [Stylosanthes scabra]|uniref:Uncharacterized protein n=1 Tax=Stylosanthes scabra TaxID=79078 RepID=A0ABU6WSI4_9FABA|nr:hypothetical protein [Stylosanthes scabra]